MSRYRIMMALAAAAAVGCAAPPAVPHTSRSTAPASTRLAASPRDWAQARAGGAVWGKAIEVPGLGALNAGGEAQVISVSCASAGNCAAGGFYLDRSRHPQAFVASQRNGRWGTAIEVPGTAALNADGEAHVSSVSCGSAGNCTAGGSYKSLHGRFQAFVASMVNGRWGQAIEVPGTAALNKGAHAEVSSVSCASAGNCTAGGDYTARRWWFPIQVFVASQRNGRWGTAIEVPGTEALNAGGVALISSVSCASAGNCAVGGSYKDGSGIYTQVFVASQRNGRWDQSIEVPGTVTLRTADARVTSVSCASAGNCAVGGYYHGAFVASQRNGRWGTATEVPGTATRVPGAAAGAAQANSVSCASAGNCAAGGLYLDRSGNFQAFVAIQRNGRWGTAIEVPGTAALNAGGEAQVNSVSCNRPGPCTAGGFYKRPHGPNQGFVVSWS